MEYNMDESQKHAKHKKEVEHKYYMLYDSIYRVFYFILKILFIFREGEGERQGAKHKCVIASCAPPTGDLAHNPGICPDWESNWRPFGLQAGTQSTEPH